VKYELADLQMPEMNGLETAIAIRDRWPCRRIRIIAVTSCSHKGDREMCIRAGMDGYTAKPTKNEDILALLELYRIILHKKNL